MADVPVKIFRSRKTLVGVSPSIPSGVEGEPLPPVNPPGSNPSGGTSVHNDLQGIQGGIEGERYHLTEAERALIGGFYELIETQSTVIKFDKFSGYVHGNSAVISGAMTYDFTGAIRGVVVIVKHKALSFTVPSKSVVIAGYYSPNVDNYIFFELIKKDIGNEVIIVTISQNV
jgi:hypothetical protein